MIRKPHVLRPVLGRNRRGHTGRFRHRDHLRIDAFRVLVDFNFSTRGNDAGKYGFPERVTLLRHAAFTMRAQSDASNSGAGLKQRVQRIAAIRRVSRFSQAQNAVRGIGRFIEIPRVSPETKLKIEAAIGRRRADVLQQAEIAVAFFIGQQNRLLVEDLRDADLDLITGNIQEKWVRKVEIRIANFVHEIVTDSKTEVQPIETMRGQHRQIIAPRAAIVEPGLVFHLADEGLQHAANAVRRLLHDSRLNLQRRLDRFLVVSAVRQFEQRINNPARIAARRNDDAAPADGGVRKRKRFRRCRRARARRHYRGGLERRAADDNADLAASRCRHRTHQPDQNTVRLQPVE